MPRLEYHQNTKHQSHHEFKASIARLNNQKSTHMSQYFTISPIDEDKIIKAKKLMIKLSILLVYRQGISRRNNRGASKGQYGIRNGKSEPPNAHSTQLSNTSRPTRKATSKSHKEVQEEDNHNG